MIQRISSFTQNSVSLKFSSKTGAFCEIYSFERGLFCYIIFKLRVFTHFALAHSYCALCRNKIKSREYLYFECSFTENQEHVMGLCRVTDVPIIWDEIVQWGVTNLKGKGFRANFFKLVWWATIYHIQLQRNSRCQELF